MFQRKYFGLVRPFLVLAAALSIIFPTSLFQAHAQSPGTLYKSSLSGKGDLPVGDNGNCHQSYEPSGYVVASISSDRVCDASVGPAGDLPAHVRIEVSVALRKGDNNATFSVYFGFVGGDAQAHYHFSLTPDGKFSVTFLTGGDRVYPFSVREDSSVLQGLNASNRLAIEIRGGQARFFINGKEVGSILARTPITGGMGFGMDEKGAEAIFSDLLITDLGAGS